MKIETRLSPRGEFVTVTGTCRVVSAHRMYVRSTLVVFELAADTEAGDTVPMKATADLKTAPFAAEVADRPVAFVVEHRFDKFRFRIDSVRQNGVNRTTPFADLGPGEVFSALAELEECAEQLALAPPCAPQAVAARASVHEAAVDDPWWSE